MKGEKRFAVYVEVTKYHFEITTYDRDSRNPVGFSSATDLSAIAPLRAISNIKISLGGPWSLVGKVPHCLFCLMLSQIIRTHQLYNTPRFPPTNSSRVDLDAGHHMGGGAGHFMCSVNKEILH